MVDMRIDWLRGRTQAPLATALGCVSIALIAGVLAIDHGGKLTMIQMLGLGAAALLAILATAEAARAGRARPDGTETAAHSDRSTPTSPPKR